MGGSVDDGIGIRLPERTGFDAEASGTQQTDEFGDILLR